MTTLAPRVPLCREVEMEAETLPPCSSVLGASAPATGTHGSCWLVLHIPKQEKKLRHN